MTGPPADQPYDPDDLLRQLRMARGHFALESGYHGDLYLDLDRALGAPDALNPSIQELARRIAELDPELICGPLTGGAFLAFTVAAVLSRRFCWSTRTARSECTELYPYSYRVEGDLRELAGARTVILDDAINAGSATRATLADLRHRGLTVTAVAALATIGPGAHDLCRDEGLTLVALAHLESNLWAPENCPLCGQGQAPIDITS